MQHMHANGAINACVIGCVGLFDVHSNINNSFIVDVALPTGLAQSSWPTEVLLCSYWHSLHTKPILDLACSKFHVATKVHVLKKKLLIF